MKTLVRPILTILFLAAFSAGAQGFFMGGRGSAPSVNLPTPTAYFGFESNALDHTGANHFTTNGGTMAFTAGRRGRAASFSQAAGVWLTGAPGLSTNAGRFEWAMWFQANPGSVGGGDVLGWWRTNFFAEQFRVILSDDQAGVTTPAGMWFDSLGYNAVRVRMLSGPATWRVGQYATKVVVTGGSLEGAYTDDRTNFGFSTYLSIGTGQTLDTVTGTVRTTIASDTNNLVAAYDAIPMPTNAYSRATQSYVADGWNLLTFAYTSNAVQVILNNQLTNGYALGAPIANFTNHVQVARSLVSGLIATFALDELVFFSGTNLTDHQRATLYNSGYGRTYTNGIGWR
jgi:hypothetical protein